MKSVPSISTSDELRIVTRLAQQYANALPFASPSNLERRQIADVLTVLTEFAARHADRVSP